MLDTHKLIVGTSGGGKTTTARGELEQLLDQRRHVVVIDPMDVYYGERSDVAGTGPGYDIPIFGGAHGDVPIGPGDGDAIARIIIEHRISTIVSIRHLLDEAAQRAFVLAFCRALRDKPRQNFHLVIDEADIFAPEVAPDSVAYDLTRQLAAFAKNGRSDGYVLTLITQRPADISKKVISQIRTLVSHMLMDPRDQEAVGRYLKQLPDRKQRTEVMMSLAGLAVGERWVYSPQLQILERGFSPPIATFDSSFTPAPGEIRVEPRMLSQVDMSAIAAALAKPTRVPTDPDAAYEAGTEAGLLLIEKDRQIAELKGHIAELDAHVRKLHAFNVGYRGRIGEMLLLMQEAAALEAPADAPQRRHSPQAVPNLHSTDAVSPPDPAKAAPTAGRGQGAATSGAAAPELSADVVAPRTMVRGKKALHGLVAVHPAGLTEPQWATLSRLTRTGGTWASYKTALKAAGFIEQRGHLWYCTDAGIAAIGATPRPMPGPGIERALFWADCIPGVSRMMRILVRRFPDFVERDDLAAGLDMAATGGTFGAYLSRLRANALLEENGKRMRLSAFVMGEHS